MTCRLLLGFLLPPGQTRFVFWRQLSRLHGLCRRRGSHERILAAQDSRRGLFPVCHFFSFCQMSEPPLDCTLRARSGEGYPPKELQVVSALSGLPRERGAGEVNCSGRGSFDRGDLKEVAGAAGRAMERAKAIFESNRNQLAAKLRVQPELAATLWVQPRKAGCKRRHSISRLQRRVRHRYGFKAASLWVPSQHGLVNFRSFHVPPCCKSSLQLLPFAP